MGHAAESGSKAQMDLGITVPYNCHFEVLYNYSCVRSKKIKFKQ